MFQVSSIVSPSLREEVCAFDVRPDGAFSGGGGPAPAWLLLRPRCRPEQQRRPDVGEFFALRSAPLPPASVKRWFILNAAQSEDVAPPRPPLPRFYDYGDVPPEVPPLPKEASVIRHTSVRGLKRQSDERRRDRESGQYVANGDAKVSGCSGAFGDARTND